MGIFDFLFGKKKSENKDSFINKSTAPSANDEMIKIMIDDEQSLIKISICLDEEDSRKFMDLWDSATLEGRNYFYFSKDKWEKALEEYEIRKQADILLAKTVSLNNQGIEQEKAGDFENAIKTYEECVKLGFRSMHQYDRLIILYHKLGDFENEKRILKLALELYPDSTGYIKKLAVLNGTFETKVITEAPKVEATTIWGDIWEERILEVPEFDFYFERETNPSKYEYNYDKSVKNLTPIWEVKEHFKALESEAKSAEDLGNQELAVKLYEQMVAEKYYMPSPYDRLIIIYSKAGLTEDEIRILKIGIAHFKQLREKRKEYVMHLAQKYYAVEFATERIENGKKITYYNGVFELYNPFPIVERWEKRLHKLQEKLNK